METPTRRPTLIALLAAATLGMAAVGSGMVRTAPASRAASAAAATLPDSLGFEIEYAGMGAEGVDLVWRGVAGGTVPGRVTIRLGYAGGPGERHMPVWPVNVRLFFSADDARSAFAAELSGSVNWRNGQLRATGLVTDGVRLDAPLEQRVQLRRPGLSGSGTLVFLPRVALGAAADF